MINNTPIAQRDTGRDCFFSLEGFANDVRLYLRAMLQDNAVGEIRAYSEHLDTYDPAFRIMRDDEQLMMLELGDDELLEYLRESKAIIFDGGNTDGQCWLATCSPALMFITHEKQETHTYTVIGMCENSGQIFSDHVRASSESEAFYWAAKAAESKGISSITYITAILGEKREGKNIFFPGEGTVCLQTVLETFDSRSS